MLVNKLQTERWLYIKCEPEIFRKVLEIFRKALQFTSQLQYGMAIHTILQTTGLNKDYRCILEDNLTEDLNSVKCKMRTSS